MSNLIQKTYFHSFPYGKSVINVYHVNKGEGLSRHEHNFNHATLIASGSIIIRKENKEIILNKESEPLDLVANEWHELEALEDNTVFINIFDKFD